MTERTGKKMDEMGKAERWRYELYQEAIDRFKMKNLNFRYGPPLISGDGNDFINLRIIQEINELMDERLEKILEGEDGREEED